MSQTTSGGSIPPFVNHAMKLVLRSPVHGMVSKNILLITFIGRKSGKTYTTPVSYSQYDNQVTIFTHAAWWKNLRSGAPVTLRIRGQEFQGLAESVAEDKKAVAAGLMTHLRKVPSDARYYDVTFDEHGNPYSNSNYQLLGLIIAAASGESYADYIQKHILTPLGMSHTYTSPAVAKENGLAVGHQYWFGIPFAAPNLPIPPGALASAGLISSADDLARYMIALLNGGRCGDVQILSSPSIDELQRGAAEVKVMGISLGKYGMGWVVDESGGTKTAWHSGTLPDFASFMALLPEQKKGMVLLFNASHHWMNPVLSNFGGGVAALLAGKQPNPIPFVRMIPGVLRGQLLIPTLQITGVAATLWLLRRWRLDPKRRPSGARMWGLHILLPLVPNLLAALTLKPVLSKRRGYLMLYMPDYSWIAMVCGSFSLVWSFLRTGLVLGALRGSSSPQRFMGRLSYKQSR